MAKKIKRDRKMTNNTFKKSIGKLLRFAKPWWAALIIAIIFGIVGTVSQIFGPVKIQEIVQIITNAVFYGVPTDTATVTKIAIMLVCVFAAGAVFLYFENYMKIYLFDDFSFFLTLRNCFSISYVTLKLKFTKLFQSSCAFIS